MVKDMISSNQEQLFRIIYASIIFAYKKKSMTFTFDTFVTCVVLYINLNEKD